MEQIEQFFGQGGDAQGSTIPMLIMFGLIFAIMYFLLIRPQQKQQRRHQDLISSLKKGDDVVLSSGIVGRIFAIEDRFVILEVAEKVRMKVVRSAVSALLGSTTGTLDSERNK